MKLHLVGFALLFLISTAVSLVEHTSHLRQGLFSKAPIEAVSSSTYPTTDLMLRDYNGRALCATLLEAAEIAAKSPDEQIRKNRDGILGVLRNCAAHLNLNLNEFPARNRFWEHSKLLQLGSVPKSDLEASRFELSEPRLGPPLSQ